MRELDLSQLYRSAIGFDRLAATLDKMNRGEQSQPSYPPYNIELLGEHQYRITMAVAGFEQDELSIQSDQGNLTITGRKKAEQAERHYLYQGIAARNFERRFQLADHVRVVRAKMENGLLHVDLLQEIPEAMKPRTIDIE
ncbi:Hsp20 family protein [Marinobacterium arenosum]|uniref:Hsp20 family protein n=1 Tax=Marinobacterium arenosum TaxID=2862496 RepID=UPI001C943E48|nr:Hsp20 family protein [Marinobacterium arenosum]MBY4675132.1 Hsp20 family protein [Marinobacterium arenosum]